MADHLSDPLDQASEQEAAFRELALAGIAANVRPERHPDFDGEHCMSCGAEIEEGRLALHKIRCVECQTAIEKRNKQRGM